jgi:ketosteroid isomerase-like protein
MDLDAQYRAVVSRRRRQAATLSVRASTMGKPADREVARDPQDLARLLVSRQRAGDADGMAALYALDAVLDCGSGTLARGRDAIRAFYAGVVASGRKFELGDQRPAILNGDVALTSTRLPNGVVTAEIARRQTDGTWLWVIDQPAIA